MNRRRFLTIGGGALAALRFPRWAWAGDVPKDIKITRIVGFDLVSPRPKLVGNNSRLGVHGDHTTDRMVRLSTNAGIEGLGHCRASEEALGALLGKSPLDFITDVQVGSKSPLGSATMPLWDLLGKLRGEPVHKLQGAKGPERVPVYDGSIYFADLLPDYASRWQDRFKEEIDMGLQRGHRAFKIKVGRGAKWMAAEEGYQRDKEVLRIIRRHAGPGIILGIDANNGYDLARTKRLFADLPDINLRFAEEMFPEQVDQCLELKAFFREQKLPTLIADGETQDSLEVFKPFVEARAIDVYQADMNRFGIEGIMAEAAMVRPAGALVGPHNWGSLLGFYAILHVGRAISNFFFAENDPADSEVLIADGYVIKDGKATAPETPGFGLRIDEAKFAAQIKPRFELR
jgi:L-alanine-DL-glutamate epimerase-like enolase superfamily enzyme